MADTRSHADLIIEELLPRAKSLLAEGERRLAAQESKVADLERKGRDARQSRMLLSIMRETMTLQNGHVELLQREVRSEKGVQTK